MKTNNVLRCQIQFGNPRTYPDCYYVGICRIEREDSDDFWATKMATKCCSATALISCNGTHCQIRFLRETILPCALKQQFVGNVFRIMSPYFLPDNIAVALKLSQNIAWELQSGDYPVQSDDRFLTVAVAIAPIPEETVKV